MELDKPFPCDVCRKAFRKNHDLIRHTRTHTGEKPYACDICEKTFSQSNSLKYHNRSHTGEKPYSCKVCQKFFSRSSILSRHCTTSAHLKRKKSKNIDSSLHRDNFIAFGETIKLEDIKEEINEEESVLDPLSIHQETENSNICEDIQKEVKEEESVNDPLSIQGGKGRSVNDNICNV